MNFIELADGRRIAYRQAGSGPPLVLLHGWSMSSVVFTEVIESLAADYNVLVPDLRGHGASEPAEGYGFADFADDLRCWFEALELQGASLLGWSLGGQVALQAYPGLRQQIDRLILVGSTPCFCATKDWPHGLPGGQVRAMARDLGHNYAKTMSDFFALQFAGEAVERQRYRRIVEFAVRAGRLPDPQVALAALATLRCGDLRPQLEKIDCPVLVMHGGLDRIVPPGAGLFLAEHLPRAQYHLMPEVGHAPFLSQLEETVSRWRQFLA